MRKISMNDYLSAVIVLIPYFMGAMYSASFNMATWQSDIRGSVAISTGILTLLVALVLAITNYDNKITTRK